MIYDIFFKVICINFLHLKHDKKTVIMEYKILKTEINDGIALVTISRPEALNALNTRFFSEMDDFVAKVSQMPEVREIGRAHV